MNKLLLGIIIFLVIFDSLYKGFLHQEATAIYFIILLSAILNYRLAKQNKEPYLVWIILPLFIGAYGVILHYIYLYWKRRLATKRRISI